MNQDTCPICPNHCSKENLSCGRGRIYFSNKKNDLNINQAIDDVIIEDLRSCGHLLHHNREINTTNLFVDFKETEKEQLHELLSKILNNNH